MQKIKAILVDDEEGARNVLTNLLERCCPEIVIVGTSSNVPEAVEEIKAKQPQVVFLDVQMPNYAGYEIIDFFDTINFEIIFVTAFDHYAIKAFELSAIDYLVKPINRNRLKEAIDKLSTKVEEKNKLENYQVLIENMKKRELDTIIISELGNKKILKLHNITAIEAEGAYSLIHLLDEKPLLVSKPLKHFEELLPEKGFFFRSHRAWIINLQHIKSYSKSNNEIMLEQNIVAKVSKYRIADFQEAILSINK